MNATPEMPPSESPQLNFALLVLRVACALPFLYHGSGILFGVLGGPGPVTFAAFMHAPPAVGYLVGLAQFAGGLAILTGRFSSHRSSLRDDRHARRDLSCSPAAWFRHQSQRVRIRSHRTPSRLRLATYRPRRLFAPKRLARSPP